MASPSCLLTCASIPITRDARAAPTTITTSPMGLLPTCWAASGQPKEGRMPLSLIRCLHDSSKPMRFVARGARDPAGKRWVGVATSFLKVRELC